MNRLAELKEIRKRITYNPNDCLGCPIFIYDELYSNHFSLSGPCTSLSKQLCKMYGIKPIKFKGCDWFREYFFKATNPRNCRI